MAGIADRSETYANQYFTGSQASIWIGDVWVDEVFGIQFSASQSLLPIWGYASSFFDAVARGKVMVHGFFDINFIDEGYLYAVLNERLNLANNEKGSADSIAKQRSSGQETVETTASRRRYPRDIIFENLELLKQVSDGKAPSGKNRRVAMGQILNLVAQLDSTSLYQLASEMNQPVVPVMDKSIIYDMIPFTLKGYFGNPELGGTGTGAFKEIKDCFLIGNEMIIDQDEPIKERYSFLARMHI